MSVDPKDGERKHDPLQSRFEQFLSGTYAPLQACFQEILSGAYAEQSEAEVMAIEDPEDRAWTQYVVSARLAEKGEFSRAVALADAIPVQYAYERASALGCIALETAIACQPALPPDRVDDLLAKAEQAIAALAPDAPPFNEAECLGLIARACWLTGRHAQAKSLWDRAVVAARRGEETARDQQDLIDCSGVLWALSRDMAMAGDLIAARQVAERIKNPGSRERALQAWNDLKLRWWHEWHLLESRKPGPATNSQDDGLTGKVHP